MKTLKIKNTTLVEDTKNYFKTFEDATLEYDETEIDNWDFRVTVQETGQTFNKYQHGFIIGMWCPISQLIKNLEK